MEQRIASLGDLEVPRYADLPMQGVATWVNPHNKIEIIAIHYTADPDKRSEAWYRETSKNYTLQAWAQEYEINFKSFAGRPVYASFNRGFHVSATPLTWFKGREMWCGWDEGTHAAVFAQLAERRLFVYGGFQTVGAFASGLKKSQYNDQEFAVSGLAQFIQLVREYREQRFPGATWRDVGDPTIANQNKQHMGSSDMIFRQCGVKIEMARTNDVTVRVSAVEDWLQFAPKGKPGFVIDPSATIIIDGMAGGYSFEHEGAGEKPDKKSPYSHTEDCIQYIVLSLPFSPGGMWSARAENATRPVNKDAEDLRREWRRTAEEREQERTENWMDY